MKYQNKSKLPNLMMYSPRISPTNNHTLIEKLSLLKLMMNIQLNSTDVQNVDTLGVITHNTFIQKNIDNLTLNLIKHKKENRVLRELYPQDFKKSSQILEKLL